MHGDEIRAGRLPPPALLPTDVARFTGRGAELAQLTAQLDARDRPPECMVISAIAGTAGVGKTALAVHWAHQLADRFPDGRLYLNLRGYDPEQPMTPADALARLLGALGVAGRDVPLELAARAARYRTVVADRRMLILLDNAASTEQVRTLLPGSGSCTVVVTSRDSLAGLVSVHGAYRLELDLLPAADALTLLRRLVGARVDAEPDAARELASQCGGLPLALRIAAELAASRPHVPLSDLVVELADQQRRLELLSAGGDPYTAVRSVFSWSVRQLPASAAGAFRLLGLHPGPDFDPYAVAALAGTSLAQARGTLDLLARSHLIHPGRPGRYGMHDLLRAYAVQLASTEDSAPHRRAAQDRLFDYYLGTAAVAMDRWFPAERHRRPRVPAPVTPAPGLSDQDDARRWLDTELAVLVSAVSHTASHGWSTHTIRFSGVLGRYLDAGHHLEALTIHDQARVAADASGDRTGHAHALRSLGQAYLNLSQYPAAADRLRQALAGFRQLGDPGGEALALTNLARIDRTLGRYQSAAGHYQRALGRFRRAVDQTGQAQALTGLGTVEELRGRYPAAASHYRQALDLFRQLGNPVGEAQVLTCLGNVAERLGRYRNAIGHYRQSLATFRQLGHRQGEAAVLDSLGVVHLRLGQPTPATEHFTPALALFRAIGEPTGEAWALNGLGEAAQAAGHPADALAQYGDALAIATRIGTRDEQARAHAGLGTAHHELGDLANARVQYEQALAIYAELGMPEAEQVRGQLAALGPPEQSISDRAS